jgi:hypothetical protein
MIQNSQYCKMYYIKDKYQNNVPVISCVRIDSGSDKFPAFDTIIIVPIFHFRLNQEIQIL